MQSPTARLYPTLLAACCFRRGFALSWQVLVGLLVSVPAAVGQNLTYGTYISEDSYESPTLYSYATPGGFNYTNGIQYQGNLVGNLAYAGSFAILDSPGPLSFGGSVNVGPNQLGVNLSANSSGYTYGFAQMWDTLTFGGLAQFGSGDYPLVNAATITMTVSTSAPTTGVSASAAWGLDWFEPGFAPTADTNCGMVASFYQCGYGYTDQEGFGTILPNGNPTGVFPAGRNTYTYTTSIPLDDLIHGENGVAFFIATVAADNNGAGPLVIDPSITVTTLLPGVTVSSASGLDYAAVPLPADAWLLGSSLIGLICFARRRQTPPPLLSA